MPRQRDTSHIDVLHSQHHTGRVRVAEPQLPLLRALVHTVPAEKSSGGIAGKCVVDWRTGRNSSKPFRSPAEEKQQLLRMQLNCISWEDEVRRVMKGEEHFEHNKEMEIVDDADNIKPLLSLNYDVSSYRFFEPDFVDLDNPEDPLEAVIPNGPGVEATDAGSGATGLSMEVEAVPGQSEHRAIINRLREMRNSRTTSSQEVSSYAKRPRDNISQQRVGYKVRSNVAAINHSKIALTHTNTKPDLSEAELRCFHRPRLKSTFLQRPWIISLPAATPASKEASISASRRKFTDAYKQDLSLANNNNDFIVLEYAEEFPPIMLNNGMASTMINYFRQPDDVDDANDERRQRARLAADKRLERLLGAAVGADGASSAGSMQFRLPRHVSLLLRKRFVKQTYEHDVNIPRLALGETKVISADDESPFLGKLDENEIQQSIANNLFCAPIYAHKPNKTDFLMVRTNTSANQLEYSLRIIPHIFLCGQLEPQKIVPRPSKKLTKLQEKFYRLAAIRSLKVRDSQTFEDLQKKILNYCNSSRVRHKQEHKTEFKNILKKIAERKQTIDGPRWFLKDDIYYNNSNTEAEGHTEEEIAGSFTPEDVCLQESCNAAEYRLVQDHIHDIELAKLETWISRIHRSKLMMQMRVDKLRDIIFNTQSLAQSSSSSKTNGTADNRTEKLGILRDIFVKAINRMDKKLAAARFIFDRLVTAPWNTTKTFVESLLNSDGKGRMELVGVGDPSGRGEGFAYVCHHQDSMTKKSQESLVKTDKCVVVTDISWK